jgi:hypothetical protein
MERAVSLYSRGRAALKRRAPWSEARKNAPLGWGGGWGGSTFALLAVLVVAAEVLERVLPDVLRGRHIRPCPTQAENILAKETKETPVIVDHIGREHPYKGFLVSHGRP